MRFQHKKLASGRWNNLSFFEQMANIGSEVERTISWKEKGNSEYSKHALERAFELLYLTIDDKKNKERLKELTRLREVLIDFFYCNNQFSSTSELWKKYFYAFSYAARVNR